MTNRTLQQRAHALQDEIARALEPGNKRRLKHTEAMDILARVDGFRNREAAQSGPVAPTDADGAIKKEEAAAKPTFDPQRTWFRFDVPFEDDMGLLGANTNGAPPDSITGFRIETNEEDHEFETDEPEKGSLWLHATRRDTGNQDYDWMLSAPDWQAMKAILGMIIVAERGGTPKPMQGVLLFANAAQLRFDAAIGEEGYEDTMLHCIPSKDGFDLHGMHRSTATKNRMRVDPPAAIVRMEGGIGKAGIHRLLRMIQDADAWYEGRKAIMTKEARLEAARAPADAGQ